LLSLVSLLEFYLGQIEQFLGLCGELGDLRSGFSEIVASLGLELSAGRPNFGVDLVEGCFRASASAGSRFLGGLQGG
jgi:hypothetical protein